MLLARNQGHQRDEGEHRHLTAQEIPPRVLLRAEKDRAADLDRSLYDLLAGVPAYWDAETVSQEEVSRWECLCPWFLTSLLHQDAEALLQVHLGLQLLASSQKDDDAWRSRQPPQDIYIGYVWLTYRKNEHLLCRAWGHLSQIGLRVGATSH